MANAIGGCFMLPPRGSLSIYNSNKYTTKVLTNSKLYSIILKKIEVRCAMSRQSQNALPKRRLLKGADAEDDLRQKIGLAGRNNILFAVAKVCGELSYLC